MALSQTTFTDANVVLSGEGPLYKATLIRGRLYVLRDKVFRRDEPVIVNQWERDHLAQHAVERVLRLDFDPYLDDPDDAIEAICALTFEKLE